MKNLALGPRSLLVPALGLALLAGGVTTADAEPVDVTTPVLDSISVGDSTVGLPAMQSWHVRAHDDSGTVESASVVYQDELGGYRTVKISSKQLIDGLSVERQDRHGCGCD